MDTTLSTKLTENNSRNYQITLFKFDILASIYAKPCSFIELCKRDFLNAKSAHLVHVFLSSLERDGLVRRTKIGIYKAYRAKARKELNSRGYEVE